VSLSPLNVDSGIDFFFLSNKCGSINKKK
jgi:hypothetical protein